MKKPIITTALFALFSNIASAHPGHGLETAYAGFMHPMTGWDHLLVMLAIGLWAAKLGGSARWQLPLAFVSVMAIGVLLGHTGFYFSEVEVAIAISVILIGAILMVGMNLNNAVHMLVVASVAFLHGMAHGVEIQANQSGIVIMAMLLATALLHLVGLILGSQTSRFNKLARLCLAGAMLVIGGISLIA